MASPNSSWTEIITTTIQSRTRKLRDNVSKNTAILMRLSEKGKIRTVSGGDVIAEELEYAENGTFMWYQGYETLNINPSDIATAAQFAWKQAAAAVTMSGLEMLQNSGKEQMINLIRARVANAERTFKNNLAVGLYSDGTGTSSKTIGGLQLIVADTNTNTVGGISGTTYTWWQNVSYDLSSVGSTASATNIQTHMNNTYVQLCRNNEGPDLALTDNVYYTKFLGSLQTIQRITDVKMGEAGFQNLKYIGMDVVLDGGRGGNCPASHMYMLEKASNDNELTLVA